MNIKTKQAIPWHGELWHIYGHCSDSTVTNMYTYTWDEYTDE